MLMLTTPEFHKILCRKLEGKVASGLEIVCEPLPPDVQAEVETVQQTTRGRQTASAEVFPVVDPATGDV